MGRLLDLCKARCSSSRHRSAAPGMFDAAAGIRGILATLRFISCLLRAGMVVKAFGHPGAAPEEAIDLLPVDEKPLAEFLIELLS